MFHLFRSQRGSAAAQPQPLDMEEQRSTVIGDRWRSHAEWCDGHAEASRLSLSNRRVALKCLLHEAHRRHAKETLRSEPVHETRNIRSQHLTRMWDNISSEVMLDMRYRDNTALVMKNLSCMCIFLDGRQCHEYGENPTDRQRRVQNQQSILQQIAQSNSLFLAPEESDDSEAEDTKHQRTGSQHGFESQSLSSGGMTNCQSLEDLTDTDDMTFAPAQ